LTLYHRPYCDKKKKTGYGSVTAAESHPVFSSISPTMPLAGAAPEEKFAEAISPMGSWDVLATSRQKHPE
jgi:hypothetical protein